MVTSDYEVGIGVIWRQGNDVLKRTHECIPFLGGELPHIFSKSPLSHDQGVRILIG